MVVLGELLPVILGKIDILETYDLLVFFKVGIHP